MGQPMAENLLEADFPVQAYDIDPNARELFKGECAECCSEHMPDAKAGECFP